jgi:hypothetical protein
MPTTQEIMIKQLDSARLTAQQYRTARRILDRTHPENGYARLSYEEMAVIVESESQQTVRGHLAALAAAGLITYKRNSAVHVYWHIDACVPETPARAESSVVRANCSAARAPEPPVAPVAPEPETPARAESSVVRANCSVPRAKSSVVRTASLKATTTSRQAGLDTTASQPAGRGSGKPQPPEPLTDQQQRALAMLTDPAIGLDEPAALRIARRFGHGMVLTQCCRYLRDVATGKVEGPAIIGYRLSKSYGGSILPQDHRTEFWERHGEQRTRWLPEWQEQAEAAAIDADDAPPAAPPPSKPKPEPGTPAAWWAQLQADFALHQAVGSVDSVLQDSWVIDYADGVFTIGIADGFRLDWVEKKLRNQVKRRLAVITGLATVDVTFQVVALRNE